MRDTSHTSDKSYLVRLAYTSPGVYSHLLTMHLHLQRSSIMCGADIAAMASSVRLSHFESTLDIAQMNWKTCLMERTMGLLHRCQLK